MKKTRLLLVVFLTILMLLGLWAFFFLLQLEENKTAHDDKENLSSRPHRADNHNACMTA